MFVVAVLLAAGGGTRYAGPQHKLLSELGPSTVGLRSLGHALAADIGPVVVVTGAVDITAPSQGALPPSIAAAVHDGRVTVVHNPRWIDGQAGSVRLALDHADRLGADAVVIGLADQPGVTAEAWRRVATAGDEWSIVVASYDGRRGPHPVRLARALWPQLPDSGDDGARNLLRDHRDSVLELACPGSPDDIDTLEDLQRWRSS